MKISEYMEATAAPPNPAAVAAGAGLPVATVEADLHATTYASARMPATRWLRAINRMVVAVLRQARAEMADLEAARKEQRLARIPNAVDDQLNFRCGHNFSPEECPYEHCHVRTMAILFDTPLMPAMPKIADAIRALYAGQEHRPSLEAVLAAVERAGRMVE